MSETTITKLNKTITRFLNYLENDEHIDFIKILEKILDEKYIIKRNLFYDDYESNAVIIIFCGFYTDDYEGLHLYPCRTSDKFNELLENNNYIGEWYNGSSFRIYKDTQYKNKINI